jgi:hypothetical protein
MLQVLVVNSKMQYIEMQLIVFDEMRKGIVFALLLWLDRGRGIHTLLLFPTNSSFQI